MYYTPPPPLAIIFSRTEARVRAPRGYEDLDANGFFFFKKLLSVVKTMIECARSSLGLSKLTL